MKTINLNDSCLALVLEDPQDGKDILCNTSRIESLSKITEAYVLSTLRSQHSEPVCNKVTLELKPLLGKDQKQSDDRFDVHFHVKTAVSFSTTKKGESSASIADADTLFQMIGKAFHGKKASDYLDQVFEQAGISAKEVQLSHFKQPTAGGVVKSPNFYIAIECNPAPVAQPTSEQQRAIVGCMFPRAVQEIKKVHGTNFLGLDDLRIVKTAINEEAGKPVARFNIYVEFEASGTFASNTPLPMDFFQAISNVISGDFFPTLAQSVGGNFTFGRSIAIHPVAYIENLHDDIPDDGLAEADIVPVTVEFWIAVVVENLKGPPSDDEAGMFDKVMETYLDNRLKNVYGGSKYCGLQAFKQACPLAYKRGLPLPRFNVLRKYKADIKMKNPIPIPSLLMDKIVSGNIGSILLELMDVDASSCWIGVREGTMGSADLEKQAAKKSAFGGKRKTKKLPVVKSPPASPQPKVENAPPRMCPCCGHALEPNQKLKIDEDTLAMLEGRSLTDLTTTTASTGSSL